MIIIPVYLVGCWHKDRQWHYCHENRNLYVYDDNGEEYIITHKAHFANKAVAKRHNENLLLGITDEQYNETAKATAVPRLLSNYKNTNSFKRMGGPRQCTIPQRR